MANNYRKRRTGAKFLLLSNERGSVISGVNETGGLFYRPEVGEFAKYGTGVLNALHRTEKIFNVVKVSIAEGKKPDVTVFIIGKLVERTRQLDDILKAMEVLGVEMPKDELFERVFSRFIEVLSEKREISDEEKALWETFVKNKVEVGDEILFSKCYTKDEIEAFRMKLNSEEELSVAEKTLYEQVTVQYAEAWKSIGGGNRGAVLNIDML